MQKTYLPFILWCILCLISKYTGLRRKYENVPARWGTRLYGDIGDYESSQPYLW